MTTRVLILGAGFGGLEVAKRLSEACPDKCEVTIIDKTDGFCFGFSKLDVMFGKTTAEHVAHPYSDLEMPSVTFVSAEITDIDPERRTVQTSAGEFSADVLVVALGADVDPAATPGLLEGGYEFYTESGAFALRDVLADFEGGRVVVGIAGTPFKCPPAPSETAMLVDTMLRDKGIRQGSEVTLVMPFGRPIPPSPEASSAILEQFEKVGIRFLPEHLVVGVDPERKVVLLSDDAEEPYDLFLCVPKHVAPEVVRDSALAEDGWIPVSPHTLQTRFPGVYAVGDCTSVGTPKAGVFSEGQAVVAAQHIIGEITGQPSDADYDGYARCYLEFGESSVAQIDITFAAGQPPHGELVGPSPELVMDKDAFGANRIKRWFNREWSQVG